MAVGDKPCQSSHGMLQGGGRGRGGRGEGEGRRRGREGGEGRKGERKRGREGGGGGRKCSGEVVGDVWTAVSRG